MASRASRADRDSGDSRAARASKDSRAAARAARWDERIANVSKQITRLLDRISLETTLYETIERNGMLLLHTLPVKTELHGIPSERSAVDKYGLSQSTDRRSPASGSGSDGRTQAAEYNSRPVTTTDRKPASTGNGGTAETMLPSDASVSTEANVERGTIGVTLAAEGTHGPGLAEAPSETSSDNPPTAPDDATTGSERSGSALTDVSTADRGDHPDEHNSVHSGSQSPRSCQTSETADLAPGASSPREETAVENSRQRYDKLFRYFRTLESAAERRQMPGETSRSPEPTGEGQTKRIRMSSPSFSTSSISDCTGLTSSDGSRSSDSAHDCGSYNSGSSGCGGSDGFDGSDGPGIQGSSNVDGGSGNSDGSNGSEGSGSQGISGSSSGPGGPGSFSDMDTDTCAEAKDTPRSIGYAGFVGVPAPQTSDCPEETVAYAAPADFTCLKSSAPAPGAQERAPRGTRGAGRSRRSQAGGSGEGRAPVRAPAPATGSSRPGSAPAPAPGKPRALVAPLAPSAGRQFRVPSWEEQRAAAARRRAAAALPPERVSLKAAWYQDFDELMGQCRGDRPLPPRAGRMRYRQPAPAQETLRQLRERVCLGCTRAFPEANYFDVYCHVNTVYSWFNWKLEA